MKIIALGIIAFLSLAHAEGFKAPNDQHLRRQMFRQAFQAFANHQLTQYDNPLPGLVLSNSDLDTDDIAQDLLDGKFARPLHLDKEADQAFDVIVREKGKYPIFIGEPGSGKTAAADLFTYKILAGDFPATEAYDEIFGDTVVLKWSGRKFLPGGYDLEAFLNTVVFVKEKLGRNIIVKIYESHHLAAYHMSVLREFADRRKGVVPVLLETDAKSYGNAFKDHPSFLSISRAIYVNSPKPEQVKQIITEQQLPKLEARLGVALTPEVVDAVIDLAKDYGRDSADPRRSLYLAEEFAVDWARNGDGGHQPAKMDLYKFVARQARLPVIPQNEAEFSKFMVELRERVKRRVVAQDVIVDGLINQFQAALTSRLRQHSVAMIMGPTGVGKTLSAEVLAEEFYGDKNRVLELDMTQFGETSGLNTLFGASNGFISSDKHKGVICEFLDGPGKGGGVLILNEIEEAHADVITRMMELFDKGVVRCGDGNLRYLGRSLVVMTSNKNTDRIMSYDSIRGMNSTELNRRLSQITQDQLKKAFTEKASYTEDSSKVIKSAIPERVDQFYFASPLLLENAVRVSAIEVDKYVKDYNKQSSSRLDVDPSFGEVLTGAFYNESLGARQIRTAVQQSISNALSKFKLEHGFDADRLVVSAKLHPSRKTVSFITVTDPETGRSTTIDGPKVPVTNKMLDPDFRQRLIDLEANLKKEVFGQDEAINAIASAIKARFLRGGKEDIAAGFLLGTTGAGKSQLGKSLAKALFGREEALGLFEMGKIQHEHDLYNIFSPPKGIIGSDQPGQLEKFLIQYPDGGVLLFDEMSNAGGGNRQMKDMIAKQFYTMFQEGVYRSPSGKVYDLSQYVVVLTGNDGEEIFKGLNSDSMLEEAYKEATKNPELVREILRKAGFSDAFIGRLAFAKLMRPTLGSIKIMIAKKMLGQWKAQVEKEQPFDIKFDDKFVEQVGLFMFSPKSGARSINHFISGILGQAVANEALKFDWEELVKSGRRAEIRVRADLDYTDKPFYKGEAPYENKAVLTVEAYQDKKLVSKDEYDFSKSANFVPQVHMNVAEATAYHEMGHFVTSFPQITGKKAVKVTIVPEKIGEDLNALGYAQYRRIPTNMEPNRQFLVANIAGLLAGSEAEILLGRARTVGRSNDVQKAGEMARRLILEHHMVPELDAAHAYVDNNGNLLPNLPEDLKAVFNDYVEQVLTDARQLAIKTLRDNWHVVVTGAELLLKHGNLSEKDLERLSARGEEAKKGAALHVRALRKLGFSGKLTQLPMSADGIVLTPEQEKASCEGVLGSGA